MEAKRAEYYDSYKKDNSIYWERIRYACSVFPKKLVIMVLKLIVSEQIGCIWMQCVRIKEWINMTGVNGYTSTAK